MSQFSVVVPAYNAATTLSETLDALVAQQMSDWECIVVNDGSTDETEHIATEYAASDGRFRVLSQDNQGSAGAYNTGVRAANGEFVVLCSADDVLLPEHLDEVRRFISSSPGYDIYSVNGYYWREDGSRVLVYQPDEIPESMSLADVIRNCFFSVGAAYRRSLFGMVGGYRTGVFGEDYDFWLRAMASGARHRYLDKPLALHRISATQKSASVERAYESDIRLVKDLLRDYDLSTDEKSAAYESIGQRRRLLERMTESPARRVMRTSAAATARFVLGRSGARRLSEVVRSLMGRMHVGR